MLLEDKEFDLFVGSKIGSFKHIKYHTDSSKNTKKQIENLTSVKELQKDDAITCMEWGNAEQTEILIGRKNKQVQAYSTELGTITKTFEADHGEGDIVGLGRYKRRAITALSSGVVKVWSKKSEFVVSTGGNLDTMKVCPDDNTLFATGGKENDLKVYRIGTTTPVFMAKNLPNDWLQLRQPIWASSLCFLNGEAGNLLAVASRYGYVRLYDTRLVQKRPVCQVDFPKMAATSIAPSFDSKHIIVGFGKGHLHQVDLRGKGRPDKGYKGAAGAITSIAVAASPRVVVSVSLDRHLRVHDYGSKELKYKQYLTSKLTHLLVQTATQTPLRGAGGDLPAEVKEEDDLDAGGDELDVLFDNMETVSEKSRKKKLKETEETPVKVSKMAEPTESDKEEDIKRLLQLTEKKKRAMAKKKREKRAKSLYHNA